MVFLPERFLSVPEPSAWRERPATALYRLDAPRGGKSAFFPAGAPDLA